MFTHVYYVYLHIPKRKDMLTQPQLQNEIDCSEIEIDGVIDFTSDSEVFFWFEGAYYEMDIDEDLMKYLGDIIEMEEVSNVAIHHANFDMEHYVIGYITLNAEKWTLAQN